MTYSFANPSGPKRAPDTIWLSRITFSKPFPPGHYSCAQRVKLWSPQCFYWCPQGPIGRQPTRVGAGRQGKAGKQMRSREVTGVVTCLLLLLGGPLPFALTTAPAPWPFPGVPFILDARRRGRRAHCTVVLTILQGPVWAPL